MLLEKRKSISELDATLLREVADYLCHASPIIRPIFECVKVYVRLHETGVFTYARHPYDLGTQVISARDISSRMNCENRKDIVHSALLQLEHECIESWPFSPGSSSWTLIEVLHPDIQIAGCKNSPTIIFRKATRLNHRGESSPSSLTEKIFKSFENILGEHNDYLQFDMVFDPQLRLENISGFGVYSRLNESLDGILFLADGKNINSVSGLNSYYSEVVDTLVEDLCAQNFDIKNKNNPGFYFDIDDDRYIVRPKSFQEHKKNVTSGKKTPSNPLPIFGMVK